MKHRLIRLSTLLACCALAGGPAAAQGTQRHPANDYPTTARADYVVGCLAGYGFSRQYLDKCACGIDTIADALSYDDYEKADAILSLRQGALGERGAVFRDAPVAREAIEKLRRAQAEVNSRCN